jgi:hypothetical protein
VVLPFAEVEAEVPLGGRDRAVWMVEETDGGSVEDLVL